MVFRKAAFVGTLALATVALAAQDGIVLRRKLVEGSKDVYTIVTESSQTMTAPGGAGQQEITTKAEGTYELKTGAYSVDKKATELEVIFTLTKIDIDGPMMGQGMDEALNKPMSTKGTLNELGKWVAPTVKSGNAMVLGMQSMRASTVSFEFPEGPVKIGDSWTVVVPKDGLTRKEDQKLTAKLVGEKEVEGKATYVISLEGDLVTDANLADMMGDQAASLPTQNATVKGKTHLKVEGTVEKETGRILTQDTVETSDMKLELVDMGLSVGITGTTTSKMKLKS